MTDPMYKEEIIKCPVCEGRGKVNRKTLWMALVLIAQRMVK